MKKRWLALLLAVLFITSFIGVVPLSANDSLLPDKIETGLSEIADAGVVEVDTINEPKKQSDELREEGDLSPTTTRDTDEQGTNTSSSQQTAGQVDAEDSDLTKAPGSTGDAPASSPDEKSVRIDFNVDGAAPTESKLLRPGDKIGELPEPVKDGFTFAGWYFEDGTRVGPDTVVSKSIVLYAAWDLISDNPDHLTEPDDSSYGGFIDYNVFPATLFPSSMALRSMRMANTDNPVIGQDHPANPGEVMLFKEAKAVPSKVNTWEVTLRVEGKDTVKTSDIVLVIDTSGSMNNNGRMTNAKAAANAFIDALLPSVTTRIGVVSFDCDSSVVSELTNNSVALGNAVDGLNADGGTFTQAGVKQAEAMLANSDADNKHIVLLSDGVPTYSYALQNPDDYLVDYTATSKQTGSHAPAGAYTDTRVGNGYSMLYGYYSLGIGRKYYNHGNSAIAEAGFAGEAGYNVFTIGLQTDSTGSGVLNNMKQGSGTFTEVTDPGQLTPVFQTIAGQIGAAVKDAAVNDPMGPGFEITASDVSSIITVPASPGASYDLATKRITWNPETLTTPISEGSDIKYAELTYTIEINNEILSQTPDGSGEYPTNGDAQISYTDADGNLQTGIFPVPKVNPVLYTIEKVLQNYVYKVQEVDEQGNDYVPAAYTKQEEGLTVTNTYHLMDTTNITSLRFEKTWEGVPEGVTPPSITIQVKAGDEVYKTATATLTYPETVVEWKNLPLNDSDGNPINYTVNELPIHDFEEGDATYTDSAIETVYCESSQSQNEWPLKNPTFVITRLTKNGPFVVWTLNNVPREENYATRKAFLRNAIAASKPDNNFQPLKDLEKHLDDGGYDFVWLEGAHVVWPDDPAVGQIKIDVEFADDGSVSNSTLRFQGENTWTHFAVGGYSSKLAEITNTYSQDTIELSVEKHWDDNDNQEGKRPDSLVVNVYDEADMDTVVATYTLNAEGGWKHTFTDLPKYKDFTTEIQYVIQEVVPEGYTQEDPVQTDNSWILTNKHEVSKIAIPVTKAWADGNNQDGVRPESVTIKLLADGADTGKTLTLTATNNWTGTFSDLDEYKAGTKISYTIEEVSIGNGYTTVITGDAATGYEVTNSRTPETLSVSGTKTWNDNENQDGMRPESITIRLLKNGTEIDSKTVTEADGWAWSFEDLPKYEAGELITYTITEDAIPDYSSEVKGFNVTNTYTPGKTSAQVTKVWKDKNNKAGQRPKQVTVRLLADGVDTGQTLVLTETNNWTGTFTDLYEYKAGKKIRYSIQEVEADGHYTSVITGDALSGFKLVNTLKRTEPPQKRTEPTQMPRVPRTGEDRPPVRLGLLTLAAALVLILKRYRMKHEID